MRSPSCGCAVHYELNPLGDGAELADDQFVADETVKVGDVLLKLVRAVDIVVIGVVANDDVGILDHVLDIAEAWNVGIRERLIWIWLAHQKSGSNDVL